LYDNFGAALPKNLAKERLSLDKHYNYILFFGFIREYKGLDILIEAFADKRLRSLPLKLIIAGEFYSDPKPYLDLIEKYQLNEYIILSNDFIPDNKVADYFCAVDLVVQPYKHATQSGVTQLAYHFNKPMIVTDVGGLAETVPDNKVGYVVTPSPAEISNSIIRFYSENKQAEFSKNAAIEKNRFSWETFVNQILKISNLANHI
jgi:glycosyltransferase involved in cell wall biosynthesis